MTNDFNDYQMCMRFCGFRNSRVNRLVGGVENSQLFPS